MEMDDLFEKHLDDEGEGDDNMENGGTGEIDGEWEDDDDYTGHQNGSTHSPAQDTAFGFGSNGHADNSQANNHCRQGQATTNLNQTRPPRGNTQTGRRPITTASKRTSGTICHNVNDESVSNFQDLPVL